MKFRVVVKDRETGEELFNQVVEAVSEEQALRIMMYHIEAWKLSRKDYFNIKIEKIT